MNEAYARRYLALRKLQQELPEMPLSAGEVSSLSRRLEALLQDGGEEALTVAAEEVIKTAAAPRLRELLALEEITLARGLFGPFGDPEIPPDYYRCQHQPPHFYQEQEIEDRDEWGRPLCPDDGTLMERVGESPPQEG